MKKSIGFLCGMLLLGAVLLFNTEGELPLHWFRPFLRIQASKAVIKNHCLILFDIKIIRKKLEFHCPKLILRFKKSGTICHVNQGMLKYGPHVFSRINGVVEKHCGSYRTFLELGKRNVSHIQIVGDPFSPKAFEKLADTVNVLKPSSKHFFAQDLKVHVSGKHVYHQFSDITFEHVQAKGGYGCLSIDGAWLKYLQKVDSVRWQNLCSGSVYSNGILSLRTGILRQTFVQAQTTHKFLGHTALSMNARDISYGEPISGYIQLQCGILEAEGSFSDLSHWKLESGVARCTSADLLKKWDVLRSYNLSFQYPLYLRLYGNRQHFYGVLDTKNVGLNAVKLRHIYSAFEIESKEKFSWDARLYADKMHPRVSGFYNLRQDSGEIRCIGRVAPEFTYAFKRYLPDWWEPFFKQFRFNETYPYANFNVSFKAKVPYSLCFGFASVKNAHFKRSQLQQFHINFGNCPGYCWLRINHLKMNQKHGACGIHWPYGVPNSQKERWIFDGNGCFETRDWLHLLQDFIGESEKFEMLKHFSPDAEAQANFSGIISSESDNKDYLAIGLKIPNGSVWDFPVRDFSTDYVWNSEETQIKNLQAKLLEESPIVTDVSWQKQHFNFQFKGQRITTKPLLNHPMFRFWTKAIPKDNLETYDGVLDLDLQGQGEVSKPLTCSGYGHLEFQNPNLSQVHILGPLTRLFSKRFKWLPVVSFDKLISDFSFTEKQLLTQNSTLFGPSTRADLNGHIDLTNQKIQGTVHFSFLDYKQLNFPVMKHFVQIFQPISKGFSAKISGTFNAPHWTLSFNPFRFALPK